ncbi:MAG: DoxX family protein [bacterium]|nr:DoxX family protein [bacterium]
MEKILGKYREQTYALMRIVVGFLFLCHGAQKILGLLGGVDGEGATAPLFFQYGLAGIIELVGGLAIALGIFTGWAAFLSSGLVAVGYFMAHQPQGALPIQSRGELAAVYAFLFLFIVARGSGIWSVGGKLSKP